MLILYKNKGEKKKKTDMKVLKMLTENGSRSVGGSEACLLLIIDLFYFICAKEVMAFAPHKVA